jgi:hypothetical protein
MMRVSRQAKGASHTQREAGKMYQIGKLGAYTVTRQTSETVLVKFTDLRKVGELRPFTIVHRNYQHAEARTAYLIKQGRVEMVRGGR